MVLKESKFRAADNSGALKTKCIHTYNPRSNKLATKIKVTPQKVDPRKKVVKKKKYLALVVSAGQPKLRKNGVIIKSSETRIVLFSEDFQKFIGSRVHGPVSREIKSILGHNLANKLVSISSGGYI